MVTVKINSRLVLIVFFLPPIS